MTIHSRSIVRTLSVIGAVLFFPVAGTLIATTVVYKPYGVHDLEREKYNQILEKIAWQEKISKEPHPSLLLSNTEHPEGRRQPGDEVVSRLVLSNVGSIPLTIELLADHPETTTSSPLAYLTKLPMQIAPGDAQSLEFSWTVPDSPAGLEVLRTHLKTNDPLHPQLPIEPSCEIARRFVLADTEISDTKTLGNPLIATTRIYSERYDEIFLSDIQCDERLTVEATAETDIEILRSKDAKSGIVVTATHAAQSNTGEFHLPVKLVVSSEADSETLELTFNGRFKSPISFYGPELDIRTGLHLGTIKTNSATKWHFFARVEGNETIEDMEVEVKPEGLDAVISPARSGSSDMKITLFVKPDAKPFDFQAARQGYAKLSSKSNPKVSNWLPLQGALVHPPKAN